MKKLILLLAFASLSVQAQQGKTYKFTEAEIAQLQTSLAQLPFKDVANVILFLEQKKLSADTVATDTVKVSAQKKK